MYNTIFHFLNIIGDSTGYISFVLIGKKPQVQQGELVVDSQP
jgi:hypothetical protein